MTSNILLITLPETEVERLKAMRDFIMTSLEGGVMVLPANAAWEVIEAPPLGQVEVLAKETSAVGADSIRPNPTEAEQPHPAQPKAVPPSPLGEGFGEGLMPEARPEPPTLAEEKRAILQRLKDYREAHGRGCLEAVSVKTCCQKRWRLSAETLRMLLVGDTKLPMEDWRKIGRALDRLEEKERNALQNEQKGS